MSHDRTLILLPSLPARRTSGSRVVLTRKFIAGSEKYAQLWGGPVVNLMEPSNQPTINLDEIEVEPAELPFGVEVISFDDPGLGDRLRGGGLVLASLSHRQNHVPRLCRSVGVPCVYVAEYSLKTRLEVIRANTSNPLLVLRRYWWEYNQERKQRAAIREATGIQCNGTPTFEDYRTINAHPLLFFDTRVTESMLIAEDDLKHRLASMKQGGPIRLLYSGRYALMKGADHLVPVADALRRRGVPFTMTLCGGGELEPQIRADIERMDLSDQVKLAGVLDFRTELVPMTRRDVDLFVCCHRTGDPAGTFHEVMACGVPMVGYDNDAFRGIVRESAAGWLAAMNQPEQIANRIAELARDREELARASRSALEFGRRHAFEQTYRVRIDHMKMCMNSGTATAAARSA